MARLTTGLLLLGLVGCAPAVSEPLVDGAAQRSAGTSSPSATPSVEVSAAPVEVSAAPPQTAQRGSALALLEGLPVKGRAPKTGFDRDLFGQRWADVDRNGCDTRNDVLARDLAGETFKAGTNGCVVMSGTLIDPYTGRTLNFAKADASAIHVDHVVALSDAWQKGAQQWEPDKRVAFANDPLNLLAVDGPTNSSKGDGDAATWLPPNKAYRCSMVARQVAVKAKYGLWVTGAERDAIARVLSSCPTEAVPTGGPPAAASVAPSPPSSPPPSPPPPHPPAAGGAVDPDYGTCKQAKANGKGPYYRGQDPEYDYYRDQDKDGLVCE